MYLIRTGTNYGTSLGLASEDRHFVNEMQTVRNRWADATTEGQSFEEIYRDLDTLQRFSVVIGADEEIIQELLTTKSSLLATETQHQVHAMNPITAPDNKKVDTFEFELGQVVTIKSNPSSRDAVTAVVPSEPENLFKAFHDGQMQTFYASQLLAETLYEQIAEALLCDQFHADLTSLQIKYPGLFTLYSLNSACFDFIPNQFRPVLGFIQSDRPRLLIAVSVGCGSWRLAYLLSQRARRSRMEAERKEVVSVKQTVSSDQNWQSKI